MPDLRSFKSGLATRLFFLRGRRLQPKPLASDGDGCSNAFWAGTAGQCSLDEVGRHGFCSLYVAEIILRLLPQTKNLLTIWY